MARRLLLLFLLATGFQVPALAQTARRAVSVEVQGLAPQLVDFAGSPQNFQSLVNGLAGGVPVTLVTLAPDGSTQTTTFTPNGTLNPAQVAQTLEAARQALISRGIAAPTAQQIGATLGGGALPIFAGNVQVTGLVPVTAAPVSTSTAATQPLAAVPSAGLPANASASTGASTSTMVPATTSAPPPRFTSDTPTLHSTSETPTPSIGAPFNPAAPNGLPSPAAQIQQRR